MSRHQANTQVPYGMYFSMKPIDMRFVGSDDELLEGHDGASYLRIPTPLAIALAPAVGGLFVFAFPTLILIAAVVAIWRLATGKVQDAADQHSFVAQSRFEPAGAYLKGQDTEGADAEGQDAERHEELDALDDEVAERRDDEG